MGREAQTVLTHDQVKCIELLIKGCSYAEISKILNVSRVTLYNWRYKELFANELRKQKEEIKDAAQERLNSSVKNYIDNLEKIAYTSKSDKTRAEVLMYLTDRVLGKPTTKTQQMQATGAAAAKSGTQSLTWKELEEKEIGRAHV